MLPDGVVMAESAVPAHRNLRLVVTKGLSHPWGMAFLPDGNILITERAGCLRIVRNGVLDPKPLAGVPPVAAQGLAGLLDIALHPRFAENKFVYLTYHKPNPAAARRGSRVRRAGRGGPPASVMTLARATWDGSALTNLRELFSSDVTTEASRIVFGRDGMIYMSLGRSQEGANAPAQDPNNYGGKLLRLRDDGTVPPDNPFVGRAGYKPEIFTMGHRNQLGLAVNPETGEIWASEQGPNGGDEINIIQAGKNYGWPVVSYGRSYPGPRVSDKPWQEGMEQPVGRVGAVDRAVGDDLLHGRQISLVGSATCSSVGCARVRALARDISIASSSTTSGRRSAASRCCVSWASVSATCGRVPTDTCTC